MDNPGFLSKRVKKIPQSGITSDRYQFLGLDQAEPDLGDPLTGVSSVGVKPYTGATADLYVVSSAGSGERYWTKQTTLIAGGVVTPGSITVRTAGAIVGSANQITDLNFVGTGVTVVNPATWVGAGASSVDVQITVSDVAVTGGTGAVPYKNSSGFLQGASDFVYSPTSTNVGIGSTIPTSKLDVLGNVKISGIATIGILTATTGQFTQSLKVGNFEISDTTTFFRIISGAVGIGTTNPTSTLDVFGNSKVSGVSTVGVLSATTGFIGTLAANTINSGFTTTTNLYVGSAATIGFITATNGFIGVLTANTINSGFTTTTNLQVGASVTITSNLQVDTNTLFVNSNTRSVGIGTTNPLQKLQVGIGTFATVVTDTARVGIGTTNPEYTLDTRGDIALSGKLYVFGGASYNSGTSGQVLLSGGVGSPTWGAPGSVTVGSANSVGVAITQASSLYYPTFTSQYENNALINVDTTGLGYNPGLNYFGIGTTDLNYTLTVNGSVGINTNAFFVSSSNNRVGIGTINPTSTLSVNGDVSVGTTVIIGSDPALHLSSGGIVTTTTTSSVVLSNLNTNTFRSAKYNIQVTATGQLIGYEEPGSSASVGSLLGGTKYTPGSYSNIALTTISGTGNDARANLIVSPEYTFDINSIDDDVFFYSASSIVGIQTNQTVLFSRSIPPTAAQNSKVTSITLTLVGSGYTAIPTISFSTPPNFVVEGVGIGSSATARVDSMKVTNVAINYTGVYSTVPTITFNSPVVPGTTATGYVGFGISTLTVNSPGTFYAPVFGASVPSSPVGAAFTSAIQLSVVGSAISAANIAISTVSVNAIDFINSGTGYTSGNFPILTFSAPNVGINTATAVVNTLGISTLFNITPGIGYTAPPILTVSSPSVGVNTAIITATLGISTFTITNPGSGYITSPSLSISPAVTDFSFQVGLGVTSTGSVLVGGSGYTSAPIISFSMPAIGINSATASVTNITSTAISEITITNVGSGYTTIPTVTITGGGGANASFTIGQMKVANVSILSRGFGITTPPVISIVAGASGGVGAAVSYSMGIGSRINITGFGTGYNTAPSIGVTAVNGITGSGAAINVGLGITSSNITITNAGYGYSSIPTVTVSSPVGVASTAIGSVGVGLTSGGLIITSPGIGYNGGIPSISGIGSGVAVSAGVTATNIIVTNVYISNAGSGYTATDLASLPIATVSQVGVGLTVGFGVEAITLTSLGIGYTSLVSVAASFSRPNFGIGNTNPSIGIGVTATLSSVLGYTGILLGSTNGIEISGIDKIYYVADYVTASNKLKISTGVGIGTLTSADVGGAEFATNKPNIRVGGTISSVLVTSPGSGYTSTSKLSASGFTGSALGTGLTFTSSNVVSNYQISEVLMIQSVGSASTSCDIIEFGSVANTVLLGSFDSDISGINGRLKFNPTYKNNTIKIVSNSITN